MFSLWTETKLNHHLLTISHRHTALLSDSDSQPRQPDECREQEPHFAFGSETRYHCRPELLRSSCDHAKHSVTVDKYVQHWIDGRVGPVRQCDVLGAEIQLPLEGVSEAGSAGSRGTCRRRQPNELTGHLAHAWLTWAAGRLPFLQACTAAVCCGWLPLANLVRLRAWCMQLSAAEAGRRLVGYEQSLYMGSAVSACDGRELGLAAQMSEVGE